MINELLMYLVPGYVFILSSEFRYEGRKNTHEKLLHAICIGFVMANIFDFFDFIFSPRNNCPYWLKALTCIAMAVILGLISTLNRQKEIIHPYHKDA